MEVLTFRLRYILNIAVNCEMFIILFVKTTCIRLVTAAKYIWQKLPLCYMAEVTTKHQHFYFTATI
jgi:hypothetical protein